MTGNGRESLCVRILCLLQKALLMKVPDAPESITIEVSTVFIRLLEKMDAGILNSFLFPMDRISHTGVGSIDVEAVFPFKNPIPQSDVPPQ